MLFPRCMLVSALLASFAPCLSLAQGPIDSPADPGESARTYQNSNEGLRSQLADVLAVAREHDAGKLKSLIRQMEVPDYQHWFPNIYGDEGDTLAGRYERGLAKSEGDLESIFTQIAAENGDFTVRRTNERRQNRTSGADPLASRIRIDPADSSLVAWISQGPSGSPRTRPVSMFVYIDGSFRWTWVIRLPATARFPDLSPVTPAGADADPTKSPPENTPTTGPVQPGVRIAAWPACIYCPAAEYSDAARKRRLEGTVVLQATILPDGSIRDIHVLKTPDPELGQMAIDSVSQWRFNPARNTEGEAVPYNEAIDVTFRLPR